MLAPAELKIFDKVKKIFKENRDFTLNPLRCVYNAIRESFVFGIADMFYYVSEDRKAAVRENVLTHFLGHSLVQPMVEPMSRGTEQYSLTIISHSDCIAFLGV